MNVQHHWKRRVLHGLALLAVLAAALGAPAPVRAAVPPNDEPAGAINIPTAPATLTMSETNFNDAAPLLGSDPTTYLPSCVQAHVHSVWYTFMPAAYGQTVIDTFGSGPSGTLDTVLSLWSGTPDNLQEIACNDDTPKDGTSGLNSEIKISLRPGIRYYIQVAQTTQVGGSGLLSPKTSIVPPSLLLVENYLILNINFASTPTARFGMYDNKSPLWRYTGTWDIVTGNNHYKKSIHRSTAGSSSARLNFDGNGFTLYFMKSSSYGNMAVWVDGVRIGVINQNNATAQYQRTWISPPLTDGIHTLILKRASKYINVDAIRITAPPDAVAPASINDLAALPGANYGSVNLSWTAPGDDGSEGLAASYLVRYAPTPIETSEAWNAATAVTTGLPIPQIPGASETMTVRGLTPGVLYYFAARARDERGNLGSLGNSPAVRAASPPPARAGKYDNQDARFIYNGWTLSNQASAYQLSIHYSTTIGKTATFVFTGSDFSLIYTRSTMDGVLEVWVDGVNTGCTINQNGSLAAQRIWHYGGQCGGALASGQHTVAFRHASGSRVNVDAIEIFP